MENTANNQNKSETGKFDWLINESILTFDLGGDIFMHYYDSQTEEDKNNPSWQNQGIYFWYDKEPFENKSLPDDFLNFETKTFLLNKLPEYIEIRTGKAIPWFGKIGGGSKLFFSYEDQPIKLPEAKKINAFTYIEKTYLNMDNLALLQDRDNYIFHADKDISFIDTLPTYKGERTTLSELYHTGKLSILKIK